MERDNQQNYPISPESKKLAYKIIAIIVLIIIAIFINFLVLKKPSTVSTNLVDSPSVENKIYSVKMINDLFQISPESLKDKSIQLKAYVVDGARGVGCHDYSILTDYEYVTFFQNRYDSKLSITQQKEAQELAKKAPVIYTGVTLSVPEEIFLVQAEIYKGHFYDLEMKKMCENGEKRFIIETKIQDLSDTY
ncbi:MAG: hypothetical protein UV05_C0032G0003 [candidate division CPR1 bacterium GW2011_GWA2_42_17]|uniref:Uncharacterized protein n=1 Tax=candidate division CPR1 bacterium GW2011_GWA2_42_17 TaxID=1618341 RepID=A0A0G0Z3D2_9BACT|nr:MAG: hypothetical protein UV05_C0032G0003 [candidate division CPR1 bacterium GW2011_GWA2_42_17]